MAEELAVQAFRLTARRHDDHVPGGLLQVDWLAVARGAREAEIALRHRVGQGWDIVLVGAGRAIMRDAVGRGLSLGDVTEV